MRLDKAFQIKQKQAQSAEAEKQWAFSSDKLQTPQTEPESILHQGIALKFEDQFPTDLILPV